VVRLALKQVADTVELLVPKAEGAVQRLLDDPRQVPESRGRRGQPRGLFAGAFG
jgi:hypothetical protein